jgi:hypothetical protein
MRAAADRDRTVRLERGRNLQNAARAAGAQRYIVQSTGFFYARGPGLVTESEPLDSLSINAHWMTRLERQRNCQGVGMADRYTPSLLLCK